MVILFFLFGVSAKHFIDEDSTTVSQNETTGSATWIQVKHKRQTNGHQHKHNVRPSERQNTRFEKRQELMGIDVKTGETRK